MFLTKDPLWGSPTIGRTTIGRLAVFNVVVCGLLLGFWSRPTLAEEDSPYASSYQLRAHSHFILRNVTVLTAGQPTRTGQDLLVSNGMIQALGESLEPEGAIEIDGSGRWLTAGLIDVHSHLGNYPAPSAPAHDDGNEMTAPVTAEVWAEHSVWPQDPQFPLALAGGVTTLQILPGSANLIGGRTVTLKNVPGRSVYEMKFPDAPHGLKMACGENPKRVYGERQMAPMTRMGNVAGYRIAWAKAESYRNKWNQYREDGADSDTPERDLQLDTLVEALDGEISVHIHCYRADEMMVMMELAKEFGFRIAAFHHATEAYKIANELAQNKICAALWVDWFGFKLEANDAIQENIAMVDHAAGGCAIVHSDSARDIQRLNQEAAKAMARARRLGFTVTEADAIEWITSNPAKVLGIDDRVGRVEVGMAADLVLWNRNPLSAYALADQVWIDGTTYYKRDEAQLQPTTDFDLGNTPQGSAP